MTRARGFTLYELLLAFAILGLLAAFAWTGFSQLTQAAAQRETVATRLTEVQRALALLQRDLLQADGRGVREAYHGTREPALAGGGVPFPLELSRAGWRNPTHAARAPTQRIAYALEGGALVRYAWRVLDRAPGTEPLRRVLLTDVDAIEVAFLAAGEWRTDWPAPGGGVGAAPPPRLRAVRVALTLGDQGRVERVVELIGDGL
jgi:general secretion pathway protein J